MTDSNSIGKCLSVTAVAVVAVLTFGGRATGGQASPATRVITGDAKNGRRIYRDYGCYECHGYEGQGAAATGPRLGPEPIPMPAFLQYVREPVGDMPPYTTKVVSDKELEDIYAFLQSLPRPPAVGNIPLLN